MATIAFRRIRYAELNSRQKENYNYQKISGVLASYGFVTMRLTDDWNGADFIAQHIDGMQMLRIQLKSRFAIERKYMNKEIHICFRHKKDWYLYPHDTFVKWAQKSTDICDTRSWKENGKYSVPYPRQDLAEELEKYKLL